PVQHGVDRVGQPADLGVIAGVGHPGGQVALGGDALRRVGHLGQRGQTAAARIAGGTPSATRPCGSAMTMKTLRPPTVTRRPAPARPWPPGTPNTVRVRTSARSGFGWGSV